MADARYHKTAIFNPIVHNPVKSVEEANYQLSKIADHLNEMVPKLNKQFGDIERFGGGSGASSTIIASTSGGGGSSVTPHDLLSAEHPDTLPAAVNRGDLIVGNATPQWARVGIGAAGTYLRSNGTDPSWQPIPASDITAGAPMTTSSDENIVLSLAGTPLTSLLKAVQVKAGWHGTLSLERGGTGSDLSFTGGPGQYLKQTRRGGNVTVSGIPASDIVGGYALTGLNDSNMTITMIGGFANALLSDVQIKLAWSGILSVPRGGTSFGSYTKGDLLVATGATTLVKLPVGADTFVLTADSAQASGVKWAAGGGGGSPLTTKGDIYVFSTVNDRLPVGANGQILSADSTQATGLKWIANAGATFANPTALVELTAVNGVAITAMRSDAAPALDQGISPTWVGHHIFSLVDGAMLAEQHEILVNGSPTLSANIAVQRGVLFDQVLYNDDGGSRIITTAATVAIAGAPLDDGVVTITNRYALWVQAGLALFDGFISTAKITNLTTNGFVKTSAGDGTLIIDTNTYLTSVTPHNILSATHGDTLADTVVRGDIIVGNATPKWSRLAIGTTGKFVRSNGTDPSWQSITASDVTGAQTFSVGPYLRISAGTGAGATLVALTADLSIASISSINVNSFQLFT